MAGTTIGGAGLSLHGRSLNYFAYNPRNKKLTKQQSMVSFNAAASALLSTGLISLAPNLILFCFPSAAKDGSSSSYFLSMGQSFASGGLLGDVFFHTLPHASSSSSSSSHEQLEDAGFWVLVGFTLFFMADLCIRTLDRRQRDDDDHHHHHHKNDHLHENGTHHLHHNSPTHNGGTKPPQDKAPDHHKNMSAIILNMAADAMHNFTDGLAIGATYASVDVNPAAAVTTTLTTTSLLTTMFSSRGGLASLSILLHEVPHELGDFCTLLRAGFTKSQAILAQFVTALAAVLGTCTALYVSEMGGVEQNQILLLITAGGFVYLAAVTILPEVLLEEKASASLRLAQLVAFVAGMGMLYMVALLEEHDHHDHHHHRKTAGEAHHDHAHHGHDHHQHHHTTEL